MDPRSLPTVSVILPVKNGAAHLADSLRTVLQQDHAPLEILVFDHASTDASAEIARSFPGTNVFWHDPELTIAGARNAGIRMARGELIAFASHDDLWLPGKLRIQAECFNGDADLAFCVAGVRCFLDAGTPAPAGLRADRIGQDLPGWLTETLVARRETFDRVGFFDEGMRQADDTDWLARARDSGLRWKVLPETVVQKRLHESNLTYRADTRTQGTREVLEIARRALVRKRNRET